MSASDCLSSDSDDNAVEITGEFLTVSPRKSCNDTVRTLLVGSGKDTADPVYADTDAYLSFYGCDVVEAYAKAGKGTQIHCVAQWARISQRLALNKRFKQLDWPALEVAVRAETGAEAPPCGGFLGAGCQNPTNSAREYRIQANSARNI